MAESLRDQLSAAFDSADTVADGAAVTTETPTAPVAPIDRIDDKTIADSERVGEESRARMERERVDRLRDPDGKFAKGKAPTETPKPAAPAPAATPAALQRPSSWKKDLWPVWDKMSAGQTLTAQEARQVAEYNLQREGEFAKGVSTYKAEADNARPLMEAMAPFLPILQQHGIHPGTWIQSLGMAHRTLALGTPQQKLQTFARLAQDYGIPLGVFSDQAAQQQFLQQPIQQQQPQGERPLTRAEAMQLWQEQHMSTNAQDAVARFTADAKHEHYATVKDSMAGLLQAGLANDLESAYDAALRLPQHADIYAAVQEQQRTAQDAQRREAEAAKVRTAKARAVSTPTSTPSGSTNGDKPQGLRSSLESAFEAHVSGRV